MMKEFERFTRQPLFLKDQEDTCNALKSETDCKANAECSWCESAAVPSACHWIKNADKLPSPAFECDPKDEEKVPSVFRGMMNRVFGERKHGGERGPHHGKKDHHNKHHGRPMVESDDDNMVVVSLRENEDMEEEYPRDYEHEERHGGHGRHGRHG